MMSKGKKIFIQDWGILRFFYAYFMLLLKRFFGFRISAIKSQAILRAKQPFFEQDGFEFRSLELNDFSCPEHIKLLDISLPYVTNRLARGDQCVGAIYEGKVVGYSWRTINTIEVDDGIWMAFGDKLYYHYKGFILPEFRGQSLYSKIKRVKESDQIIAGRTHIFGNIETHNYSSLVAARKNREFTIGYTAYIKNRIGFWSWHSSGAKKWNIQLSDRKD